MRYPSLVAHPSLLHLDHRPYAMPTARWAWRQTWRDLLFAHWPVPVKMLRPLVPNSLEIDTFDGLAWVGVVPFYMTGIGKRGLPRVPRHHSFAELNLRTYVHPTKSNRDKPGVYFFSLDAENWLACRTATFLFNLPYHFATMRCASDGDWITYDSRRRDNPGGIGFAGRYRPTGDVSLAKPGTLEYFLTERYALYVENRRGRLTRGDIHHQPWPLQPAEWMVQRLDLTSAQGITLPDVPAHLLFAKVIDVVVWNVVYV